MQIAVSCQTDAFTFHALHFDLRLLFFEAYLENAFLQPHKKVGDIEHLQFLDPGGVLVLLELLEMVSVLGYVLSYEQRTLNLPR